MTRPGNKPGYVLVMVLVITAVGLLFGAGSLLMFRFQCQLRVDRQHELEKVYAVRSALNYIRTYMGEMPVSGRAFRYCTGSGRNLSLHVKPVRPIFPDVDNVGRGHFVMERGDLQIPTDVARTSTGWCSDVFDFECGAYGTTNLPISSTSYGSKGKTGLMIGDLVATNNVKWWVNIGMRGTGGWMQEDYGRRYCFYPMSYVDGREAIKDTMRICIIRNVTNVNVQAAGFRCGWPLSMEGERALVLQVRPNADAARNVNKLDATMTFFEYRYTGGSILREELLCETNFPSMLNMGVQIAQDKVTVFTIENAANETHGQSSRGYTFWGTAELSRETFDYFVEEKLIGGVRYTGTNVVDGRVHAPELRAVFEVEASSDRRGLTIDENQCDFLTDFYVVPAYQYDVFLEHPSFVTNRATVAQKIGQYSRNGSSYSILTYDTHGTENKGFRKDEREAERKRNGW